MRLYKKISIIVLSLSSMGALTIGVLLAKNSTLFLLQNIEVQSSIDDPPIDDQQVIKLTEVSVGKVNLFTLDLKSIEHRLLSKDWIREVQLQKKMPDTLVIAIHYREPKALIQMSNGGFAYVDADGKVFGLVNLLRFSDLPLIMGFSNQASGQASGQISGQMSGKLKEALRIISRWEGSSVNLLSSISTVYWESERGFRILAFYTLAGTSTRVRTMVDIGQKIDMDLDGIFFRLLNVFRYLQKNSIPVRQMWADNGKMVVVKTLQGS